MLERMVRVRSFRPARRSLETPRGNAVSSISHSAANKVPRQNIEEWLENFRPAYGVYFLKPDGEWGFGKFVRWTSPLKKRAILELSRMPRGGEVYFNKKVPHTAEGMKMFRFY